MSIRSQAEFDGIKKVSDVVATTLRKMREYARPGMSTFELDQFGGSLLQANGAKSAPFITYGFPGHTCISLNHEAAHGIPSKKVILKEGDLVNIDVSAELNGFFGDNGQSFVLGKDISNHQPLVDASRSILFKAIQEIRGGVRISDIGGLIEILAKKSGYNVIRNLVGHGIGRKLHEHPFEIPCFNDKTNKNRFQKNSVVAIETFISTNARFVYEQSDGWTYAARDNSFIAQHEHTILVTDAAPVILTEQNRIWD